MMAYGHVAHDCVVGSHTVLRITWVCVGMSPSMIGRFLVDMPVNQFLTVGAHAMIGGMTHISNDVPAYMIVSGRPATVRSVNTIGLERRGFDKESVAEIREAFKILYKRNYSLQEAIDQIRVLSENCAPLTTLVASLESSKKGIHR